MLISDGEPRPSSGGRRAVEPNWRVVGWLVAAAVLVFAGAHATGFVFFLILCAIVAAVCQAAAQLVDYVGGLREWRQ